MTMDRRVPRPWHETMLSPSPGPNVVSLDPSCPSVILVWDNHRRVMGSRSSPEQEVARVPSVLTSPIGAPVATLGSGSGVWSTATGCGDERTVDVPVRQLRKKLGDGLLLTTVGGAGYRLG